MKISSNSFFLSLLRRSCRCSRLSLAVTLAGMLAPLGVRAATYTYSNSVSNTSGTADLWLEGAGWDSVPLGASDTLLAFTGTLGGNAAIFTSNNIAGNFRLNRMSFTHAGPATGTAPVVNVSGAPLEFMANGGGLPTLNFTTSGSIMPLVTIGNDLVLAADLTATAAIGNIGTISGAVSGGGALTKAGAGTLILSGANTYTGVTNVNEGVLSIRSAGALGGTAQGTVLASGAKLQLQGGIIVTGENLVVANSADTMFLENTGGTNTWAGKITLTTSHNSRISSTTGRLVITGNIETGGSGSGQLVLQGSGGGEISGVISGNRPLIKSSNDTGTWTLSGANTYTGQTSISNGVLSVTSLNSINPLYRLTSSSLGVPTTEANGTINLGSAGTGGQLLHSGAGETTDRVINLGGASGGGTITKNGTGVLKFTSDFTATGTGSKMLTLQGTSSGEIAGRIVNGSGTTGVTKDGSGTWTLSAANTYAGITTVKNGILNIRSDSALGTTAGGTVVENGGKLQLQGGVNVAGETLVINRTSDAATGAFSLQNLSGNNVWTGNLTLNGNYITRIESTAGTLTLRGNIGAEGSGGLVVLEGSGNGEISGIISGSRPLTKGAATAGTWILSGANTYTGATGISNGTLQIGNGGTTGSISPLSAITNNANFTINRSNVVEQGVDFGETFEGSGSFTHAGSGITILKAADYKGSTTISKGTLLFARQAALYNHAPASWTADKITVASGATLALSVGGTGEFTSANVDSIKGLGTATGGFLDGSRLGLDTTNATGGRFTYAPDIANPNGGANSLGLTKLGTGILELSGTNSYTGTTVISAGTLLVNGDQSGATGSVTVSAGATLGGSGTIGGATTVNGIHSPGNSPGLQNFNESLTYGAGSSLNWELTSQTAGLVRGTGYDAVNVTGALNIDPTAVFNVIVTGLNLTDGFWSTNQSWDVFDAGSINGTFGEFRLFDSNDTALANPVAYSTYSNYGSFSLNTTNGSLDWSAVPEPTNALAGLLIAAGLLRRRRASPRR